MRGHSPAPFPGQLVPRIRGRPPRDTRLETEKYSPPICRGTKGGAQLRIVGSRRTGAAPGDLNPKNRIRNAVRGGGGGGALELGTAAAQDRGHRPPSDGGGVGGNSGLGFEERGVRRRADHPGPPCGRRAGGGGGGAYQSEMDTPFVGYGTCSPNICGGTRAALPTRDATPLSVRSAPPRVAREHVAAPRRLWTRGRHRGCTVLRIVVCRTAVVYD